MRGCKVMPMEASEYNNPCKLTLAVPPRGRLTVTKKENKKSGSEEVPRKMKRKVKDFAKKWRKICLRQRKEVI